MESPLPYDDQDDEIKSQFDLILDCIFSTNDNSSEEEIRALNERVHHEVTTKPILARIVKQRNTCLLDACTTCQCEQLHPAIKFLIEANPLALLWETDRGWRIIHKIAGHTSHCVLMPWIATNYQWVLDRDHDIYLFPSVFHLLNRYANRREETGCTAAIIRQFFEVYPQGLTQVNDAYDDGYNPLHAILMGSAECELDLFTWMAEKCPSNMLKTDRNEATPLHRACRFLINHRGYNSSEICKYLIEQCPESVQMLDNMERLPIHFLLDHCHHRIVKEVVACLLREYPESYNIATSGGRVPSSIPFIQRIKPLLDEEIELKENIAYLQDVSGLFHDALGTASPLASSTYDAFSNWATVSFVKRLEAKIELVSLDLQNECNAD